MEKSYVVTLTDLEDSVFIYEGNHQWIKRNSPRKHIMTFESFKLAKDTLRAEKKYDKQSGREDVKAYHIYWFDGTDIFGVWLE